MIEIVVHGRGGQGGVTLAKLIAGAFYRRGLHVQAFGMYGAERTGAPVEAYVRAARQEIVTHTAITHPDHVVVVDHSLVAVVPSDAMKKDGWVVVNTPERPAALAGALPGRRVATVDASAIAVAHGLGTRAVPIVNTAMLGTVARVLGLEPEDVEGALAAAGFGGANIAAAREAFAGTVTALEPGEAEVTAPAPHEAHLSFIDERVGRRPTTHTGVWASARPHAVETAAPCGRACPAGNDVRGFVRAAAAGEYEGALAVLLRTSPLPAVCGRVCPAPCMAACNRGELDAAVDVRDIERALADLAGADTALWARAAAGAGEAGGPAPASGTPVAVVGSGPAGLSAAHHLARLGCSVTLYEAAAEVGGVLRTGIPVYRLPPAVLDREVARVLERVAAVHTGRQLDGSDVERLAAEHRAVVVATGLQASRPLALSASPGRVEQALCFLREAHRGAGDVRGQAVVVAGGGTTAVDAARTALRLGACEVRIAYRRTRAQMPAIGEEVGEALEEGVLLDELLEPAELRSMEGRAVLVCRRLRLGEPDASGRPRPVRRRGPGSLAELSCDRLLLALGEDADLSLVRRSLGTGADGGVLRAATGSRIWLAGDVAGSGGTVAGAVGSGRRVARAVAAALRGDGEVPQTGAASSAAPAGAAGADALPEPVVHPLAFARVPPQPVTVLEPHERRHSFAEVRRGFTPRPDLDPAQAEAARCFACGLCTACDTCVVYCPEGVLRRSEGSLPEADLDYCKGCGLCVATCPRGVVVGEAV